MSESSGVDHRVVEKVGGWKRLSKRVVYDNPWIQVSHEEVSRPNGSEGIYGVVHFKTRATGIVTLDDEGNTWLVKQSRYACDAVTYEIPEGGAPLGEDPLLAAKRELKEETGLVAEYWKHIQTLQTSNSVTDEMAYLYLARGLSQGEQSLDETEDIELMKVPFSQAIEMVLDGTIVDSMSVAALLRVAMMTQE